MVGESADSRLVGRMTDAAIEAAARRIEELDTDLASSRRAYALLSGYVCRQVDAALRRDKLPANVRQRVADKIKARIRRDW